MVHTTESRASESASSTEVERTCEKTEINNITSFPDAWIYLGSSVIYSLMIRA